MRIRLWQYRAFEVVKTCSFHKNSCPVCEMVFGSLVRADASARAYFRICWGVYQHEREGTRRLPFGCGLVDGRRRRGERRKRRRTGASRGSSPRSNAQRSIALVFMSCLVESLRKRRSQSSKSVCHKRWANVDRRSCGRDVRDGVVGNCNSWARPVKDQNHDQVPHCHDGMDWGQVGLPDC